MFGDIKKFRDFERLVKINNDEATQGGIYFRR